MAENKQTQEQNQTIPEAAFHSPISSLDIPNHICELLVNNGFDNIGELVLQLETDKKNILDISGIGPKILEQIETATEEFEPEIITVDLPYHPPPVPTLADFYKPPYHQPQHDAKEKAKGEEKEQIITYNSPVPSLADYFDPDNMVVVLETVPAEALKTKKKNKKKPKPDLKAKKKTVSKKKTPSKKKSKAKKGEMKKQSKKDKASKKVSKKALKKKSKKKSDKKKSDKKKSSKKKKHKKSKKK